MNNGSLFATNCLFSGNKAVGGAGGGEGEFQPPGGGGHGFGGVLYAGTGIVALVECRFEANHGQGGIASGSGSAGASAKSGGALGGAVAQTGGSLTVIGGQFLQNAAFTPNPTTFRNSGSGSTVSGGAIFSDGGTLSLTGSEFITNTATGGDAVRHLGTAGAGQGGAVFNSGGLTASHCRFFGNVALAGMQGDIGQNGEGGAIFNAGSAEVLNSTFTGNRAIAGSSYHGGLYLGPDGVGKGGAVYNSGSFMAQGNTFAGNLSEGASGGLSNPGPGPYPGSAAFGGALYNTGLCSITNSTWAANQARGGTFPNAPDDPVPPAPEYAGGDGLGGGVCNLGGTLHLVHATLSGNSAVGGLGHPNGLSLGGGIQNSNGAVSLVNSIVANSVSGSNAFGTLVDLGHNLSSDSSCDFGGPGSLNNTDPVLGPLGRYGGPTPTMPLLSGSPAIDAGDPTNYTPTDQRGRIRPYGTASDIGAFESSPPFVIRGKVSGFTFAEEVLMATDETSVMTTNRGVYSLETLTPGDHTVIPSSDDYLLVPTNRLVTVGPDQLGVNFKAYHWNTLSLDGVSNNFIQLMYAGTNGHTVRLLASSNLFNWAAISTNTVGSSNLVEFQVPVALETPNQFYRTAQD